ncbi:MAG: phospholipase D-like domain-containing protein, partial [Micromonosporaceae bacterium]
MRHPSQVRTRAFCLAVALAAAALAGTPAGATGAPGTTAVKPVVNGAVFNNPIGTPEQQSAIITQLERLIDSVPAGEEINAVMFEFKHPRIAERLVAAADRGVRVKLIVDEASVGAAAYDTVRARVGGDDTAGSYAVVCNDQFPSQDRGCIGTRVITYANGSQYAYNHNKFFLFSRLGFDDGSGASNVVWQSSSNLSEWYEIESYNDSVTFSDQATYDGYRRYFADLRAGRYDSDGNNNYYWSTPTGSTYRAYFFPRREASVEDPITGTATDTVDNVLDEVSCSYTEPDGSRHQTDIRITMWSFTRTGLANKLAAKRRAGCWVD